ncbi:hypothetical protein TSOC_014623, partial [Tetrabaena socialis]
MRLLIACGITLIAILLVIALLVRQFEMDQFGVENLDGTLQIPQRIWTYWDDDEIPPLVQRCIDSWRRFNPTFTITVLKKETLATYLDVDLRGLRHANENPAKFSDFVRLHVLSRHGGIWMDASVICQAPLDWIFDVQEETGVEFVGYRTRKHTLPEYEGICDVLETSVFACVPGAAFVTAWRDELMRINDYADVNDYIAAVRASGVDTQNAILDPYWVVYIAQIATLQRNRTFNKTMYLLEACDTIFAY